MPRARFRSMLLFALLVLTLVAPSLFTSTRAQTATGSISLISSAVPQEPLAGTAGNAAVSADGNFVAFESNMANLTANDPNRTSDIFVRNLRTGEIELISANRDGVAGNSDSRNAAISADGRYVVFESQATDLVDENTGGQRHIFLRDRAFRQTYLVSKIDAELANAASANPAISDDGRRIAFESRATNLSPNATSGFSHIFVADLANQEMILASIGRSGPATGSSTRPAISGDGLFVAFESQAGNLVNLDVGRYTNIYVRNLEQGTTSLASAPYPFRAPDGPSAFPVLSANGNIVAFQSLATNLVAGDTNNVTDVFVHNLRNETTRRVSVTPDGQESDNDSFSPALSADGSLITFGSTSSRLVDGDSQRPWNVLIRDLKSPESPLERVAVSSSGEPANQASFQPGISADGSIVVFETTANNLVEGDTDTSSDIFARFRESGATVLVSDRFNTTSGNAASERPAVSADGRFVAFESAASNLIPGDSNGYRDIFVRDRETDTIERVSLAHRDGEAPAQANGHSSEADISADGRFVAFTSAATNLLDPALDSEHTQIFVYDREQMITTLVSIGLDDTPANGNSGQAALSADGRFVAFVSEASNLVPLDTNGQRNIFVRDLINQTTTLVSIGLDEQAASGPSDDPAISADGRIIAFESFAPNLVPDTISDTQQVFLYDITTGAISLVSINNDGTAGDRNAYNPAVSADGRFIAFDSFADNLAPNAAEGRDVFVHDRQTGTTIPISAETGGLLPSISADGRYVAFHTDIGGRNPNSTESIPNIYVYDLVDQSSRLISQGINAIQASDRSFQSVISADGRVVAFISWASNLASADTDSIADIFVYEAPTYSVSGRITDENGVGLPGILITAGSHTASSDTNGNYTLNGLLAGTHTFTPTLPGYRFDPVSRQVNLNDNLANQDFTALLVREGEEDEAGEGPEETPAMYQVYLPLVLRQDLLNRER